VHDKGLWMRECDVAIIGAGPYGLAARAALRDSNLSVMIFGQPMSFWRGHMPSGMLLRSPWVATHVGPVGTGLTLDDYERSLGRSLCRRLPLSDFVAYGEWVQRRSSPDLDLRQVSLVSPNNRGFHLTLNDGEEIGARRVVVAAGIKPFPRRPDLLSDLPPALVSHTIDHADLSRLSGREVVVVGGGQSALESAALLHEAGARVEVVVRSARVHWLTRSSGLHRLGPITQLLYAPSDIGPAGISRLVALPLMFRTLPRDLQNQLAATAIRPAGAAWLVDRLDGVPITTDTSVVSARMDGARLRIALSSGTERTIDHLLLGTGFRIQIEKYSFLDRNLLRKVRSVAGYPVLGRGFESSVAGLHFLGAPAAWSYGPLMRFVAGTAFASPQLARAIARTRSRRAVRPKAVLDSP
jgi:hypothetical protein